MDVKEEDILGEHVADHWYYRSKGAVLLNTIGHQPTSNVIDVGAGSGVFSKLLLQHNRAQQAFCVDPAYPADEDHTHAGKPLKFRRDAPEEPADLVMMMDVLEHVDDDLELLKLYSDPLKPGARVFITVPAFQSLWSGHDVFLEHRRRYRRHEVDDLVKQAGLNIVKSRYFYGLLFPFAFLKRRADRRKVEHGALEPKSDLSMAPPPINSALVAVHTLERWLVYPWNRYMGLSVVCLAEKPG